MTGRFRWADDRRPKPRSRSSSRLPQRRVCVRSWYSPTGRPAASVLVTSTDPPLALNRQLASPTFAVAAFQRLSTRSAPILPSTYWATAWLGAVESEVRLILANDGPGLGRRS